MSEMPPMLIQMEAFDEIAHALRELLSDEDECIYYVARWMGPYGETDFWAVRSRGKFDTPRGVADSIKGPGGDFGSAEIKLRRACYQEGKGTWFGLEMTVLPSGEVTAEYNYTSEPEWEDPIDPTIYVQEQEEFPRDLEHQPEWFKRRLVEGRVALEEWRRAQGR
jgi:hypothetical protein